MRQWIILLVVVVMLVGATGCGQILDLVKGEVVKHIDRDANGEAGNGKDNGEPDVDFSNPDEVFLAFWADYTTGNFDRAAQYLTDEARADLHYFRSVYEANSCALAVWSLYVGSIEVEIVGRGIVGDWMTLSLVLTLPDFEAIFNSDPEVLFTVLGLMALSGFENEEFREIALEMGLTTYSQEAWNSAFTALENTVAGLPVTTLRETIELVEEDGKWKVDEVPLHDIFD